MARAARAKAQIAERAAMLKRGANRAAEVDAAAAGHPQSARHANAKSALQCGQRVARRREFDIGVIGERRALDSAQGGRATGLDSG